MSNSEPTSEIATDITETPHELGESIPSFHWLFISLLLALTFFAWYYSDSQKRARLDLQFDREATQVSDLIRERMQEYEDALWGGVALLEVVDGDIDIHGWSKYADCLQIEKRHPGINGIGIIHSIGPDALEEYIALQRIHRPEFRVHPKHSENIHFPISFIVPVKGNESAVGLDIAHEGNRLGAARKARDSGEAQITGPITLVQDNSRTPGFLFYAPFYDGLPSTASDRQQKFKGMVYAPFVVKKLMEGVLEQERRLVSVRLSDESNILYDELTTTSGGYDSTPLYKKTFEVPMYGRTWRFDIWSATSFRKATNDRQPITILVGGLLIDGLLFMLFFTVSQSSKKARAYADSMTVQLKRNNLKLRSEVEERCRAEVSLRQSLEALRESRTKLKGLADQSFNFIGLMTVDGILLEANRTALQAAGVAVDKVINRPFWETPWWTHSPSLQQQLKNAIKTAAKGERISFEATHLGPDGSEILIDFSIKPIFDEDGKTAFLVPEGRDITTQKRREAELKRTLKNLERSNEELEQFAYVASHDLQEPLRKITAFCDLLADEYDDKFDAEGKQYLNFIVDGARRMRLLIQSLLSYSRLKSQTQPPQRVQSGEALKVALQHLDLAIMESGARLDIDDMPKVDADPNKLVQLFQNLVGNAIKYRSPDRTPTISITGKAHPWGGSFRVKDNGIGIAPEHYDRVFGIFRRLHGRDEYSGTGIGLALCKRIVEQLGGRIWIERNESDGCTFGFTILNADQDHQSIINVPRQTDLRDLQQTPQDPTSLRI